MKKVLSIFLSIAVMLTMLAMPVMASTQPTVTVQSIEEPTAIGGEVKLEVSVANNPGFTNFDWKVDYDADRLELKAFETIGKVEIPGYGTFDKVYLPNFSIANNIETGKISVGNQAAFTDNGTLFCVIFTVKENAPSGEAKVSIVSENIKNDGVPVTFTYVDGFVNVDGIDCDEGHDYGDWKTRTEPTCETEGLEYRTCKREGCGFEDTRAIPVLGHAYGDFDYEDEENHKKVCANDADHVVIEAHEFDENQYCPICKYQGETTGGSTTGGSTTGGSTTGGSTTGGSTTGGTTTGGNTTGGNTTGGGTTGGTTTEGELPSIGETTTGWENIKEEISNSTEETITVEMNGTKEVPAEVFEKIAEAETTVEFNMGNGISWTIKSEDIPEETSFSEINLNVQLKVTTIPEDVVEEVEAEEKIQLELAHNGEFGLTMRLNLELGSANAGKWANLYYFNTAINSLELQETVKVDENGNVVFSFNHASNYVIAIDDADHSTGGSTTGGSTTGGSTTGGSTTGGSTTGGSTTGGSTTGGSTTGGSTTGGSTTGGSTTGGSTTGGSTTGGSTTGGTTTGGSTTGGSTTGGTTCDHIFGDWTKVDDTNHKRACPCGEEEIVAHTWDAGVVTTPPTYTATGVKTFTCPVCNGTKTEVIPVLTRDNNSFGGGIVVISYTVKFDSNGGSNVKDKIVKRNSVVKAPEFPTKEGYTFAGWYTDKELTTAYNFDTPVTKGFTLYAKWTEGEEDPFGTAFSFRDVAENDWFYNAVKYAYDNNLVNGISDTEFAPDLALTRAMLATIIHRMEGEPATNKSIPFVDVDMNAYYANAISWAQQNEIVKGISETEFAPNLNITREQIAAIIYRYVQYKGYDVSVGENTNLLSYTDANEISEYAIPAMQYAVGSGLMKGRTTSSLNPKDNATRAELVQILYNFFN